MLAFHSPRRRGPKRRFQKARQPATSTKPNCSNVFLSGHSTSQPLLRGPHDSFFFHAQNSVDVSCFGNYAFSEHGSVQSGDDESYMSSLYNEDSVSSARITQLSKGGTRSTTGTTSEDDTEQAEEVSTTSSQEEREATNAPLSSSNSITSSVKHRVLAGEAKAREAMADVRPNHLLTTRNKRGPRPVPHIHVIEDDYNCDSSIAETFSSSIRGDDETDNDDDDDDDQSVDLCELSSDKAPVVTNRRRSSNRPGLTNVNLLGFHDSFDKSLESLLNQNGNLKQITQQKKPKTLAGPQKTLLTRGKLRTKASTEEEENEIVKQHVDAGKAKANEAQPDDQSVLEPVPMLNPGDSTPTNTPTAADLLQGIFEGNASQLSFISLNSHDVDNDDDEDIKHLIQTMADLTKKERPMEMHPLYEPKSVRGKQKESIMSSPALGESQFPIPMAELLRAPQRRNIQKPQERQQQKNMQESTDSLAIDDLLFGNSNHSNKSSTSVKAYEYSFNTRNEKGMPCKTARNIRQSAENSTTTMLWERVLSSADENNHDDDQMVLLPAAPLRNETEPLLDHGTSKETQKNEDTTNSSSHESKTENKRKKRGIIRSLSRTFSRRRNILKQETTEKQIKSGVTRGRKATRETEEKARRKRKSGIIRSLSRTFSRRRHLLREKSVATAETSNSDNNRGLYHAEHTPAAERPQRRTLRRRVSSRNEITADKEYKVAEKAQHSPVVARSRSIRRKILVGRHGSYNRQSSRMGREKLLESDHCTADDPREAEEKKDIILKAKARKSERIRSRYSSHFADPHVK